jgi:hypothetical protein
MCTILDSQSNTQQLGQQTTLSANNAVILSATGTVVASYYIQNILNVPTELYYPRPPLCDAHPESCAVHANKSVVNQLVTRCQQAAALCNAACSRFTAANA